MANNHIPEDAPAMWAHDYDRKLREDKAKAEEDRIKKQKQDEINRELHKEQLKIKDKINYTDELAVEICERISAGELLINICNDSHMPTVRRCNQWLKSNPDFNALMQDAINDRLSIFEEQVIQIADDAAFDIKEVTRANKKINQVDAEVIQRAKLRVEVRFRHLKAGRPQKWGDTSTLITKTQDEQLIDNMTTEELEKKIADLDDRDSDSSDNVIRIV
jgi:hypothetical protein